MFFQEILMLPFLTVVLMHDFILISNTFYEHKFCFIHFFLKIVKARTPTTLKQQFITSLWNQAWKILWKFKHWNFLDLQMGHILNSMWCFNNDDVPVEYIVLIFSICIYILCSKLLVIAFMRSHAKAHLWICKKAVNIDFFRLLGDNLRKFIALKMCFGGFKDEVNVKGGLMVEFEANFKVLR